MAPDSSAQRPTARHARGSLPTAPHLARGKSLRWERAEQADYSIGGGRFVHIPHVVSVVTGPTVGLGIRMLPGQTPDDFTAQATAIAYNLGVAEVRVIPLGSSLIRLNLNSTPAAA